MARRAKRLRASAGVVLRRLEEMVHFLAIDRLFFSPAWESPKRTFQRKAHASSRLNAAISDRLAHLDGIARLEIEVLGAQGRAVRSEPKCRLSYWLGNPSDARWKGNRHYSEDLLRNWTRTDG